MSGPEDLEGFNFLYALQQLALIDHAKQYSFDRETAGRLLECLALEAEKAGRPVEIDPRLARLIGQALDGTLPREMTRKPRVSADLAEGILQGKNPVLMRLAAVQEFLRLREIDPPLTARDANFAPMTYEAALKAVARRYKVSPKTIEDWVERFSPPKSP